MRNSAGAISAVIAVSTATLSWPSSQRAEIAPGKVVARVTPRMSRKRTSLPRPIRKTTVAVIVNDSRVVSVWRWPRPRTASQRTQRASEEGARGRQRCANPHCSHTTSESRSRLIPTPRAPGATWCRLSRPVAAATNATGQRRQFVDRKATFRGE